MRKFNGEIKMKEQLVEYISTNFGIDLYPKADGRVEIPKEVVLFLGWDSCEIVNTMFEEGNVYVSNGSFDKNIPIKVSHGRVRIPVGVLKSAGLHKKSLIATFDLNCTMRITADNSNNIEAINEFIDSLTEKQKKNLKDIFIGDTYKINNEIPNMELVRAPVNQSDFEKPKMFLLDAIEDKSFIFKPVGNPYKFKFCWSDKVPLLSRDEEDILVSYAIPGINMYNKDVGFLLVDQITFGKVCYILKKKEEETGIDKDLIFIFSPKTRIGSFKVYENPKQEVERNIIDRAKLICANPENFLLNNFDIYSSGKRDFPPTSLTSNTIGRIKQNEREAGKN